MQHRVRIDKWLWAVRIYKTRGQAADACRAGKVKIDGASVKPSREVRPGDVISVRLRDFTRTVRVKDLLSNRVGAKLTPDYAEDLTPEEEYERPRLIRESNRALYPRSAGRPAKRDRRMIDKFKETR